MANRYWVGGTAAWDAANVWSATSGGAGGASNPTSTDDVIIDQAGPYTIQAPSSSAICRDLSISGSSVTLSAGVQLYGSLTALASTTINPSFLFLLGTGTLTLNGATCSSDIWFFSGTPSYTLGSALTTTGGLLFDLGTLTTNNYNLTVGSFQGTSGTASRTLNLGTSTLTATSTGNSIQIDPPSNFTFNYSSGAAMVFTATGFASFNGGGGNYPPLRLNNTGNATINGSNTFDNISSTTATAKTISFEAGATNTFVAFNLRGSSGNLYTLNSTASPTQAAIKKSGTWYMGANSVDVSNNTGLVFTDGSGIDYLSVSNINGVSVGGAGNFLPFL